MRMPCVYRRLTTAHASRPSAISPRSPTNRQDQVYICVISYNYDYNFIIPVLLHTPPRWSTNSQDHFFLLSIGGRKLYSPIVKEIRRKKLGMNLLLWLFLFRCCSPSYLIYLMCKMAWNKFTTLKFPFLFVLPDQRDVPHWSVDRRVPMQWPLFRQPK